MKIFKTQFFLYIVWVPKLFRPKSFWTPIFFCPNILLDPKLFTDPISFDFRFFFFGLNYFFGLKFFFNLINIQPKTFFTRISFYPNILFDPKNLLNFRIQIFFNPNIFSAQKLQFYPISNSSNFEYGTFSSAWYFLLQNVERIGQGIKQVASNTSTREKQILKLKHIVKNRELV